MTNREFDEVLAFHCSPALAGIKSANLITIGRRDCEDVRRYLDLYRRSFKQMGISFEVLYECESYMLVLLYRSSMLWKELSASAIQRFLAEYGYHVWDSLEEVLLHLKERCCQNGFPHEIGLFLGFPLEDVIGFIRNKGQKYKLCGYWKVYSDETAALRKFETFNLCRNDFCRRVKKGASILDLFRASSSKVCLAQTAIESC